MRIAILVKQIPVTDSMELGPDGRLVREETDLEISAYCRRAISEGVALVRSFAGTTTAFTLGPPSAKDVLREAMGWGVDAGVLITDPLFAGSDTVVTTAALAAAIEHFGPFDLVLVGKNSLDAETGQVGPGVAERLGWGFLPSVKHLELAERTVVVTSEEDDGESDRAADLPLVVATAERLIEPCKVDPSGWPPEDDERLTTVSANELTASGWRHEPSPTSVGEIRVHEHHREQILLEGSVADVAAQAIQQLELRGALRPATEHAGYEHAVHPIRPSSSRRIGVLLEPDRDELARELLGEANELAERADGRVVAIAVGSADPVSLSSWGADEVEVLEGNGLLEEDVARAVAELAGLWTLLVPGTAWGREVAGRISARTGAGLTGDALELEVEDKAAGPALVAWKSALGGQLLVAIRSTSGLQMATVRPGALSLREPRPSSAIPLRTTSVHPHGKVAIRATRRNDDVEELERAAQVVGVGAGVAPEDYDQIYDFAKLLGGTVAATRRVTDQGWMPRARQIGITGRSIRPQLYVAIGISGKFNHSVGVRAAGTVLAINSDPLAPIFSFSDLGIVGDWRDVLPLLAEELSARH